MIFNSLTFILFLFLVIGLYWFLSEKPKLLLIFIASLIFYAFWRIEFVSILLLSTVTDYFVAQAIYNSSEKRRRRRLLYISLSVNLGLLFIFKYFLFFSKNILSLGNLFGLKLSIPIAYIILPLGISFYTFQTLSYTIDVYRNTIKPEKNFLLYADYVLFFPQLVAGPILRAGEVIHQLVKKPPFDVLIFFDGIKRILFGLFLKVVLADNIAPLVDSGFSLGSKSTSAIDIWTLSLLFGFQIYFDFSAYSHIAVGSAKLMGINFPENFNFPFLSISPQDFWKRWHISLSAWIRDYIFLPVSYKISSKLKQSKYLKIKTDIIIYFSGIFIAMTLCGFWHGANWTFVLWGMYHALLLFIFKTTKPIQKKLKRKFRNVLNWAITFLFVTLGWMIFRSQGIDEVIWRFVKIFSPKEYLWLGLRENTYLIAVLILLGAILSFFIRKKTVPLLNDLFLFRIVVETLYFTFLFALVFIFLRPINQFIYFQF